MASCYDALDRNEKIIRILQISPEPHPVDNRIQCSFIIADVRSGPVYEALSYTWGRPDSSNFRIWVDDVLCPVRRNLLCALRVLRANGHLNMWIDALCIDQTNLDERNHQVNMMGRIYRNAQRVLTWLGTPDPFELNEVSLDIVSTPPLGQEVLAFDFVDHVAKQIQLQDSYVKRAGVWRILAQDIPAKFYPHFKQLHRLCFAEYWDRLWIVQEVCLAKKLELYYGTRNIDWRSLESFMEAYKESRVFAFETGVRITSMAEKSIIESRPWFLAAMLAKERSISPRLPRTFETLLYLTMNSLCQDRRDKIYGIRGLVSRTHEVSNVISVDYSRSLLELYAAVMKFQLSHSTTTEHILGFSQLVLKSLLYPNPDRKDYAGMASQRDREMRLQTEDERKVAFDCKVIGKIEWVAELPTDVVGDATKSHGVLKHEKRDPRRVFEVFALERTRPRWAAVLSLIWKEDKDLFPLLLPSVSGEPELADTESSSKINNEGTSDVKLAMFVTQNNIVGFAPEGIQEGDILCAAEGRDFRIFTIVRPNLDNESEAKHLIVGRAAVNRVPTALKAGDPTQGYYVWLPQHYLFDDHVYRRSTHRPKREFPKPETAEMVTLECSLCEMHVLTCPLRSFEIRECYNRFEYQFRLGKTDEGY